MLASFLLLRRERDLPAWSGTAYGTNQARRIFGRRKQERATTPGRQVAVCTGMWIACPGHPATRHHTIPRWHVQETVQIGSGAVLGTIEYVAVGDARLWTARQGNGPPLALLHGGPGMWDYLRPVAAMLDDQATVYRYDQRACGRSSGDARYGMATAVEDLDALRAHWHLDAWVVAGHSFGATLALAYALRHPDRTRGLLYLSGTGIDPAWRAEYRANRTARLGPEGEHQRTDYQARLAKVSGAELAAISRAASELAMAADLADPARATELARAIFVEGLDVNHDVNQFLGADATRFAEEEGLPGRLRTLDVPTLVLHGDADPRPAWAARQVAALLPHAQLHVLPRVGHFPWLEQPAAFAAIIRAFL